MQGEIGLAEITPGLLEKYVGWLNSVHKPKRGKKKRLNDQSIAYHLIAIRSVFAYAARTR